MNNNRNAPASPTNGNKAQAVQSQVDEVIGIMHNNIEKVVQRGEKLESLQNKTDDLQQGALQFKRGANKSKLQTRLPAQHPQEPAPMYTTQVTTEANNSAAEPGMESDSFTRAIYLFFALVIIAGIVLTVTDHIYGKRPIDLNWRY